MMNKYLIKIFLFFAVLVGVISIYDYILCSIVNSKAKLKVESSLVVLGHSHPECAINDSIVKNLTNLASSGESYFYTYAKLKKVLELNKNIETVFVEFTNNQINQSKNNWIWKEPYISRAYPKYAPFMSSRDKLLLLSKSPVDFANAFLLSVKKNVGNISKKSYDFTGAVGGFISLDKQLQDTMMVKNQNFDADNKMLVSESNLAYLEKVIELCKNKEIKVVLIRCPQHKKYHGVRNESAFVNLLASNFSDVEFLDFSKFPLEDNEYADLEHLNSKGSKKFSLWLDGLLSDGLLHANDKQEFLNSKIHSN